jgi:hypothetical protein
MASSPAVAQTQRPVKRNTTFSEKKRSHNGAYGGKRSYHSRKANDKDSKASSTPQYYMMKTKMKMGGGNQLSELLGSTSSSL